MLRVCLHTHDTTAMVYQTTDNTCIVCSNIATMDGGCRAQIRAHGPRVDLFSNFRVRSNSEGVSLRGVASAWCGSPGESIKNTKSRTFQRFDIVKDLGTRIDWRLGIHRKPITFTSSTKPSYVAVCEPSHPMTLPC